MNKLLIIGPLLPPINGVSICNAKIIEELKNDFVIGHINTANKKFSENLGNFSFGKIFSTLKQYFFVFKIFNTDIVYITIGQTFFGVMKYVPFLLVSKLLKKKSIIHIHGNYILTQYDLLKGVKKELYKRALMLAEKGIVLSDSLKCNLLPFIKEENIHVLYNFIDENIYSLSEDIILKKDFDSLKIFYLSNLMIEKGILDVIQSLKLLQKEGVNFKAKFAGNIDPVIKEEILKEIYSIKGAKYVGVVNGEGKKKLLLDSNVFVFPTYYKMEGQPISLIEAMGFGNVIITTRHAGIPDIVSEKNGFFVDKKSPVEIKNKLNLAFENKDVLKKISLNNYKYAKENFSETIFLSSLKEIFIK